MSVAGKVIAPWEKSPATIYARWAGGWMAAMRQEA
jgi:hypothetical protein